MMTLPLEIKKIVSLMPSMSLKLIDIASYTRNIKSTLELLSNKKSYEQSVQDVSEVLEKSNILISKDRNLDLLKPSRVTGEAILRLYFIQLIHQDICFLNLSQENFKQVGPKLYWKPSKLRHKFSLGFKTSLLKIYQGFFENNIEVFDNGLKDLGLVKESMDQNTKDVIKTLFLTHFGDASNKPIKFNLSDFKESFEKLFKFMLDEKIPLNPEFAYLGIYLTTLYETLDKFPIKLDVKQAYIDAKDAEKLL